MVCFGQGIGGERGWLLFAQPSEERISQGEIGVRAHLRVVRDVGVGVGSDFSAYGTSSYEFKFT